MPSNIPEARVDGFTMQLCVDIHHSEYSVTRRLRKAFIVFLENASIYWSYKKQMSVESSSFGSEFMVIKSVTEYIKSLQYKLPLMGILVIVNLSYCFTPSNVSIDK